MIYPRNSVDHKSQCKTNQSVFAFMRVHFANSPLIHTCQLREKFSRDNWRPVERSESWVIPCQIIRFLAIFPRTSSDSFEIWHTCRNCLENNIRQIFFYLGQARSEIWPCEKMEK